VRSLAPENPGKLLAVLSDGQWNGGNHDQTSEDVRSQNRSIATACLDAEPARHGNPKLLRARTLPLEKTPALVRQLTNQA
jgi:hypothetical protein